MLKIGFMDYANVYPIFHFLLNDKNLEFKKGFPADLNKALREGEIDVSPSSSVEFCRNPDKYKIVDGISISSIGAVKSVCLFSKFRPELLDGRKVYFTKESNTSTVLTRIILENYYKIKPIYTNELEGADAELLIGDKALIAYYHNVGYEFIIDLGVEWYKFTKLPFVFALWLVNKKATSDVNFNEFCANLLKIAKESPQNRHSLLARYVERGLSPEQMEDYWQVIDYSLTDKHKEGLALFYKYAYELGETKFSNINIKNSLII